MAKKLTNKTSYSYSKIRWSEKDYKELHKVVNLAQREIKKYEGLIPEQALPKIKYADIKANIHSRKDFKLAISSLNKIKDKHAFDLISSSANKNVKITKWELQTAKRYDRVNQIRLQTEYNQAWAEVKSSAKPMLDIYGNPQLDEQR